ncbi:MAG TPA: hypothetical protein VN803_07610 [Gemmatimonadales bacterium]|nr:hypothetical protein [Gemmatimonadales bacterium]
MSLALLLLIAQTQAATPASLPPRLIDLLELSPSEHKSGAFILAAPQQLTITAVAAEPWPDRLRSREDEHWEDDEQTTWPAAAWIIDARTREVVWDVRSAETRRESNGLRRFSGTVRLPAGTYEAHYASYAASSISFNGDVNLSLEDIVRLGRRAKYGGPYVENGLYKEFALRITGNGRRASAEELETARSAFTGSAIARIVPHPNESARKGFELTRPTDIEVYSIGELSTDKEYDYGWIMNADTHQRVWVMSYVDTDPAGGSAKNRVARETIRLKPGRYVAYFANDESHNPDDWNRVPPTDPEFWGLTLRVANPAARAAVKPFDYQPVPEGQTIISMIGVGDDELRSEGFVLKRAMDVRVYAIGEGTSRMVDYAWIFDAEHRKHVWTMTLDNTQHAGGGEKNRLFDSTVHLEPGAYMVYYRSDGSHSAGDWNSAPPAESKYYGVSVFPASRRLNPADIGPFVRPGRGAPLAELTQMGDNEDARRPFELERETSVRVYAMGEGRDGEMFDYGRIEDSNGNVVWRMQYDETEPAGGAEKNRLFDGVIKLRAGAYVLRYHSDGSHSHADWNDDPPDDPESWGISVFRTGTR